MITVIPDRTVSLPRFFLIPFRSARDLHLSTFYQANLMVQALRPDTDAVIVEDDHGLVSYFPQDAWSSDVDPVFYSSGSFHMSRASGASVEFEFEGSAVWFYGDTNFDHGDFEVRIDNGVPDRRSSFSSTRLALQLLFAATVQPGRHKLNITNVENFKALSIDYFAYDPLTLPNSPSNSQSSSPTQSPSTNDPSSSTTESSVGTGLALGAIVGIVMGLVALLLIGVLVFLFVTERRRRRRERVRSLQGIYTQPWMQHGFDGPGERRGSETTLMRGQLAPMPLQMRQSPPAPSSGYAFSRRPESYISVEPTMTDVPQSEAGDRHRRVPSAAGTRDGSMSFDMGTGGSDRYFGSESMSPAASTVPGGRYTMPHGRRS
ncbi:hypothetical protein BKA62DRAFT_710787 [Auriculariales sp. MPI-PUGE-AT-0066]|nr:hypothetical protein BKA62DRAFT_710787 [Auriculariales sp. MPI-PUGE-AT-0066]